MLAEHQNSPQKRRAHADDGLEMDEFYKVMGEFYGNNQKKHESPTRRLMDQQKACWAHKDLLYKKMKRGEINMRDYSLTYTVDPKRTYVIQPREGEINYDIAEKNPLKFYDKVMNQDVLEHKIANKTRTEVIESPRRTGEMVQVKRKTKGLEMNTRLTKRAVGRILTAIQHKLHSMIVDFTGGEHNPEDVHEALADPLAKAVVQRHIQRGGMKLVDDSNKTVYKTQMSLIGEKGDRAVNESPGGDFDDDHVDPEEAHLVSRDKFSPLT